MAAGFGVAASKIMLVIIVGATGHRNLRTMMSASRLAPTSF
jgi:hypothetical protein